MRILLLCQGNPETLDSWSGSTFRLLHALRAAGHTVIPGDVEPAGIKRWDVAARSFSPDRRRWWVRFTLGEAGFGVRSERAARHVDRHRSRIDLILQIGATFRVKNREDIPLVLYCDASIDMATEGAAEGASEAAVLTSTEVQEIRGREAPVYHAADLIFTMSHYLADSFEQRFGIPTNRLVTIHTGANDGPKDGEVHRHRSTPPRVLFVGRDFHRKGGEIMLRAFRKVQARLPEARLDLVGPPPSRIPPPLLEGLRGVSTPGFLSRATPAGRRAMDETYRAASLFCLPTRYEPFGTAFVEAMLYGLPTVGPRAWAVPEIIESGRTGQLAEPGDPDSFAGAMLELLQDPAGARRMGIEARRVALDRFTWEATVARMTPHLHRIVSRTRNRRGAESQGNWSG